MTDREFSQTSTNARQRANTGEIARAVKLWLIIGLPLALHVAHLYRSGGAVLAIIGLAFVMLFVEAIKYVMRKV